MNIHELRELRDELESDIANYIVERIQDFGNKNKLVPSEMGVGYTVSKNDDGTSEVKVRVMTEFKL